MNELALGDGWKLYEEKGGKYDGVLTLELHTVYGKVEVRLMGKSWLDMGAGILRVYGNLKAQGPIEVEQRTGKTGGGAA